jgi:hypothetical protein
MIDLASTPMHQQFEQHDYQIKRWLEQRGYSTTHAYYDFDREILAWRHRSSGGKLTLRIQEDVLRVTPPEVLVQFLESFDILELLRRNPGSYTVVQQMGNHTTVKSYSTREEYRD